MTGEYQRQSSRLIKKVEEESDGLESEIRIVERALKLLKARLASNKKFLKEVK